MFNCLVKYNQAGRDGSGVSANWDTQLLMSNCTITNNTVTGDGYLESYGGGISVAYYAFVEVINSIIWNNTADYGPGISIGSNFDSSEKPMAEASISYSNVRGGQANIFVDTDHGSILNWDAATNLIGTSLDSPLFVTGYWGDFYLSQPDANSNDPFQTVQSPCVDSGSDLALNLDMFRHTTRTDHIIDFDNVDMGYHYPLTTDILGDFNYDGEVNAIDLALFMPYWLNEGCDFPLWCHGRDLNYDGIVNFGDYAIFAANYGLEETTPPEPNPMTWAMTPLSYSYSEIIMQATTAKDTSGSPVEYYFEATTGAGHDRDWDPCDTYIDSGLSSGSLYGYRVKARDKRGNETDWSVIGYAVTGEDVTTPAPDPMTWLVEPYATSPNSVRMVASTATDLSGVEYKFFETSGNLGANSSNWQTESEYEDFDLDPNTPYSYYVVARDLSPFQNTTQPSETVTVTTPVTEDVNDPNTGDVLPPEPNPSQWASVPTVTNDGFYYYHTMAAVESTNTDGTAPVLYYFDSYGGNGFDSGWQFESTYTTPGFLAENHSTYRVYATDGSGVWTSPSSWYHTYYGEQ